MEKLLLCFALSVFFLGASSGTDSNLAVARDDRPQGADTSSSSGTASRSNAENNTRVGGEELYNASCVVCHGPRATGGIGPRLAGNPVLLNDQAFKKIMKEGRHMMPPLTDVVTEQQIAGIRTWLKTLP